MDQRGEGESKVIDFGTNEEQKHELEAAAFLIVVCVLGFLAAFSFVVVMITRWFLR
jgi:hypothetical protein